MVLLVAVTVVEELDVGEQESEDDHAYATLLICSSLLSVGFVIETLAEYVAVKDPGETFGLPAVTTAV